MRRKKPSKAKYMIFGGLLSVLSGNTTLIIVGIAIYAAFFDVLNVLAEMIIEYFLGTDVASIALYRVLAVLGFWIVISLVLFAIGMLLGNRAYAWKYTKKRLS